MSRDALVAAVSAAQATQAMHHVENCPKCRHALKIQVSDMKRFLPPGTVLTPPPTPTP
ncbi:MAG: hypothetical protein HY679_02140 [Chloroflexi bacterium]|nr:hypothetical protein [Chloroflexota bacterium]